MRYSCVHTIPTVKPEHFGIFPPPITHVETEWTAERMPLMPCDDRPTAAQYAALDLWRCVFPLVTPLGNRYVLTLVHLRPIKGTPEPHFSVKGATHELCLIAVSPDVRADQWARGEWEPMTPLNYVQQFKITNEAIVRDRAAMWVCEQAAQALVYGRFPVEPQGFRGAREMFAESVAEWVRQARSVFDSRGGK